MKPVSRFVACLIVLAIPCAAFAEEGGAGHYAPGSFASFVDVLPGQPAVGACESKIGTFSDSLMAEAKKDSWTIIGMKNDWKKIFAFEP